ncbi:MAG TPA: hypothetical protein VFW98_13835 [Gemmatimonadaceae bacterium]|nr:hypothetical protein [Gemmatimonadaceae bacterium]
MDAAGALAGSTAAALGAVYDVGGAAAAAFCIPAGAGAETNS